MWGKQVFVGFDTETTGVDYNADKIVTAAIVKYDFSAKESIETKTWLADPGVEISPQASKVNGITNEYAKEHGRPLREVLAEIRDTLVQAIQNEIPIVIFNANFDLSILRHNLLAENMQTVEDIVGFDNYHIIDPLVIDRKVDKYRKGKRTLESMMYFYGIEVRDDLHDAQADTEVMLEVLNKIYVKFDDLAKLNLSDLYVWQKQAYKEWADGFNDYLRRMKREANVKNIWPLHV